MGKLYGQALWAKLRSTADRAKAKSERELELNPKAEKRASESFSIKAEPKAKKERAQRAGKSFSIFFDFCAKTLAIINLESAEC